MKFLRHLIKKHWLLALLLLVVLWLLPKLLNAYAYLFQSAGEFVQRAGNALKIPQEAIAKVVNGIDKTAATIAKTPVLAWLVPVALFSVWPVASAVLSIWGLLDHFKREETITVTRHEITTEDAPELKDAPLLMPGNSTRTVDDFYSSYGTDL